MEKSGVQDVTHTILLVIFVAVFIDQVVDQVFIETVQVKASVHTPLTGYFLSIYQPAISSTNSVQYLNQG